MTRETTTPAISDVDPASIFETLNAYHRSAALKGAIDLGLFTALSHGHNTAEKLAAECGADPRAMRILCDFLVVSRFLTKSGDRYGLTPTSAACLVQGAPRYLGGVARFLHSDDLLDAFRDVGAVVRHGGTLLKGTGTTEQAYEGWVEFARSMVPLMLPAAHFMGNIAGERLPGPIRVLDLAAGHGMFGIHVALHNLQASIVALDWPNVLSVARQNAEQAGITERYALLPGDVFEVEFGHGYDLVLLTNILHHFDKPTCTSLLKRVHDALRPGGLAMILEFVPNEDRVSPPMPAMFAMTMLGTTPKGDAYTLAEYKSMGDAAGLCIQAMQDVPETAQRLIIASRPE
jgi:2-polyprenyl-3-methyl-5-hydroxy-6-metoxy-1,4-benzoquinol methylase